MSKEEVLLKLLAKELSYYQVIWEITQQEAELFAQQRPIGEILPLIKKRRILFGCIEEIETAIKPLKRHWMKKQHCNDEISQQCQRLLLELKHLVQQILEADQQNQSRLAQKLYQLKQQQVQTPETSP